MQRQLILYNILNNLSSSQSLYSDGSVHHRKQQHVVVLIVSGDLNQRVSAQAPGSKVRLEKNGKWYLEFDKIKSFAVRRVSSIILSSSRSADTYT